MRAVVSAAGGDTILRDIREGAFFGELAALDDQPRAAGIQAVIDGARLRFPSRRTPPSAASPSWSTCCTPKARPPPPPPPTTRLAPG